VTSDLQRAADPVQVQRLLLEEAVVAAPREVAGAQLPEEGGGVEDLLRQGGAVTPHNVTQAHTAHDAWQTERRA